MARVEFKHYYVRKELMGPNHVVIPQMCPIWMTIVVEPEQGRPDSQALYVDSSIHVNKRVKVGPSYSLDWTPDNIVRDLSGDIYDRFIK